MKESILLIYKNLGETPLQCLERLRIEKPEYQNEKLSYIGRLDPMAEGLLLVLVGEENKSREKYLNLDKEYECEILFGFATDTYDILGFVTDFSKITTDNKKLQNRVEEILPTLMGTFEQTYPPYSSKPVNGKSLFMHSREGNINIELPKHEVTVKNIETIDWREIGIGEFGESIKERISKVNGDFRQQETLKKWKDILENNPNISFPVLKLRISCGSGFYVRTFGSDLGKKIGIPALTYSIKRTRVGEYK